MSTQIDFEKLAEHIGHSVVAISTYGSSGTVLNISLECETCNETLLDCDNPEFPDLNDFREEDDL